MGMPLEEDRPLTEEERARIAEARQKAFLLYEGRVVPHRSCGIAIAETFGLPTRPYQALRRGGITGEGPCGAIQAGALVLGELLGDPDPAGPVTENLRRAVRFYQRETERRIDRGGALDIVCHSLTRRFSDFAGPERLAFCTHIAADVAEIVAEALVRFGGEFEVTPIEP